MTFDELDWPLLDRLRTTFLAGSFGRGSYWQSARDLAQYDLTFGERIGWKWDAVLRELHLRQWRPPRGARTLVDWGCGSGIAGRRVLAAFPSFDRVLVADSSSLATQFATERLVQEAGADGSPVPDIATITPHSVPSEAGDYVLVVSHVWNELPTGPRADLLRFMERAAAVLWVEPGTSAIAREVQTVRDRMLTHHRIVAPCTHNGPCGLLVPGREADWCHHFAEPPAGIFMDGDWMRFAERAGIDLRSLPYSFLVLERTPTGQPAAGGGRPAGWERVLGRPEVFKPEVRLTSCGREGVHEVVVPKRTLPDLYKQYRRQAGPLLVRWECQGHTATHAESGPL
jgi:ribosomal protein RSM22 (predicted rRNA methylase)